MDHRTLHTAHCTPHIAHCTLRRNQMKSTRSMLVFFGHLLHIAQWVCRNQMISTCILYSPGLFSHLLLICSYCSLMFMPLDRMTLGRVRLQFFVGKNGRLQAHCAVSVERKQAYIETKYVYLFFLFNVSLFPPNSQGNLAVRELCGWEGTV